jgi:hypothetical protein
MKINDNTGPATFWMAAIPVGSAFKPALTGVVHPPGIYMRTKSSWKIHHTDQTCWAVNLETGMIHNFSRRESVIPVNTTVTVELVASGKLHHALQTAAEKAVAQSIAESMGPLNIG